MTMPDAIAALTSLAEADADKLTRSVYNVRGFSVSAAELREEVLKHFPKAQISFEPVEWRDNVVASWPDDIDDSLAQKDWGWSACHSLETAFTDYFLPGLRKAA